MESPLDLHFAPFDRAVEITHLPGDLAALTVGLAERQAASATARAQARLWAADHLRPVHGAFHADMAARVTRWKREAGVYLARSADLQAGTILPATENDGAASPKGQR